MWREFLVVKYLYNMVTLVFSMLVLLDCLVSFGWHLCGGLGVCFSDTSLVSLPGDVG